MLILLVAPLAPGCDSRPAQTGDDAAITPDSALPEADSGPPPLTKSQGYVWLAELSDTTGAQQSTVRASFWRGQAPFLTPLRDLGGGCAEYSDQDSGEDEVSAGKVTIDGSSAPGGTILLEPNEPHRPDRYLYSAILFSELFDLGTSLRIQARGDRTPPFFGALAGVAKPQLKTLPGLRRGSPLRIEGYGLTPGQPVWVIVDGVSNGPIYDNFVRCEIPLAADGSVTVPWSALAALPTKLAAVALATGPVERSVIQQGDHEVQLIASHLVVGGVTVR